nr:MAG TPA: KilA-N domain [Caudoviricetes sp.]
MNAQISVANVSVRQFNGLYSINDLHRAAGKERKHEPHAWLRSQQAIELIKELEKTQNCVIQSKQGLGTFVSKELVVHYGMWISPAFSLKVIRAFLDTQEEVSGSPKLETQTTIDERRGLVNAVKAFAIRRNLDFSTAFKMVHQRFGVEKIEQIAAPLLPAAVAYVHSLTLQSGLNGEVLDRLPENMQPKPLRNLQGAVINSLYCAEFLYQHRAAIRGLNRRLAATLNDHAADSIMFLRNVAEQAGISVPDNEYFQYFPWDGDSAEKARYHKLNA